MYTASGHRNASFSSDIDDLKTDRDFRMSYSVKNKTRLPDHAWLRRRFALEPELTEMKLPRLDGREERDVDDFGMLYPLLSQVIDRPIAQG
jgi:hypothetical protein